MKRNSLNLSKNYELICGIDEAGRGPVLGPMVICGVCFPSNNLRFLNEIGVKDSKKLTSSRRIELAQIIKRECHSLKVKIISAKEIDNRVKRNLTMNRLELLKYIEIINELKPNIIIVDAVDVNEERFGDSIKRLLDFKPKEIISKHKADDIYPIVSASSIIAKEIRDNFIETLRKKYGDFGSGYPSDVKTINFLRDWIVKNKRPPSIARKTWDTTKKILNDTLYSKNIREYLI
ncbi:MAG: ribonuclease HII [Candidatus Heimdallarchaeota archaeon]